MPEETSKTIAALRLHEEIRSALLSAAGLMRALSKIDSNDAVWYERYSRILEGDAREIRRKLGESI